MEERATEAEAAQHPLSLRFMDPQLEERYQRAAGAEGLAGYRLIALASAVVWAPAAFLIPAVTDVAPEVAIPVGLGMSAAGLVVAALSRWARTLDRQHALASLLTSANGVVLIGLALLGGAMQGYAVAGAMLLFLWGFVSRTRFVYAGIRTAVVAIAFVIAVSLYRGPGDLALDVLMFTAASVGTLVGLRMIERHRRRLFQQDLLIREQSARLAEEMAKSDELLLNVLPASIAARLRDGERTIADDYGSVSVLFGDVVGFTPLAARLKARDVITLLGGLFSAFDELVPDYGLEKIKTVGDAYMVVGGIGDVRDDHALRVVHLAFAMLDEAERHEAQGERLQLRIGIHSGPAVGGVIGTRKLAFDLWGDTVNVASRLQTLAEPGQVHISEATWKLIRDEVGCEARGESELRGHSRMRTYTVVRPMVGSAPGRRHVLTPERE